jgi:hypothetical protein
MVEIAGNEETGARDFEMNREREWIWKNVSTG